MKKEEIKQVKARSAWTDEDVERRARTLMMERGVLEPAPFVRTVGVKPQRPAPSAKAYELGYGTGIVTQDADVARQVANSLLKCDYDFLDGDRMYTEGKPVDLNPVNVYDPDQFREYRSKVKAWEESKKAEDKAYSEWSEANDEAQRCRDDARQEAYEARHLADSLQKVKDTYGEYVKLADGNGSMAGDFLLRAFPSGLVQDAEDYFGVTMVQRVEAAPAEEPAQEEGQGGRD